jgi:hypothetical protein
MTPTEKLWILCLGVVALAACEGCSVNVNNSEGGADRRAPAPVHAVRSRQPTSASSAPATTASADEAEGETDEQAWNSVRAALGKPGELRDGVLAFIFPRADLDITLLGNDIPVAAGLASEFRFYRCPCGLLNVIGQFVVADYEANDVLDALRAGHVEVASVGPFMLHERPRLLLVRFQGENKRGGVLAGTLRTALSWTGEERMAPQQKIELPH